MPFYEIVKRRLSSLANRITRLGWLFTTCSVWSFIHQLNNTFSFLVICIISHLSTLNSICHSLLQCSSVSKSLCKMTLSSSELIDLYITQSVDWWWNIWGYVVYVDSKQRWPQFCTMWYTPNVTVDGLEFSSTIITCWIRFSRKWFIHDKVLSWIP